MKIKIVGAKRTPIGKFLGSFYQQDVANICCQVIKKIFDDCGVNKKQVDFTIIGVALPVGLGQGIARKISINSGIPIKSPAYSVNMVCGSGMQAIANGCNEIKLGSSLILTGGFEFMSNVPYATNTYLRFGKKFGDFNMIDLITHDGLYDAFSGVHMGITAENIARSLNISREEQDKYAHLAHKRALKAVSNGEFKNEIVPIKMKDYKNNSFVFENDEFPNPNSTFEKLSSLKPVFIKNKNGTVTAGNASGINDGAAFVLLASDDYCKKHKIESTIEIVDCCVVGCNPQKMGLGPYYAIKKLLAKQKIEFKDIDIFEINEAFSAQILGCIKLLSLKYNVNIDYIVKRTNVNGSGLGLGHPLGCTGARIVTTLYNYMLKNKCKYGIASLCIGGGMGYAMLLKKD